MDNIFLNLNSYLSMLFGIKKHLSLTYKKLVGLSDIL